MNELMIYGLSALFVCFAAVVFFLSRLPTDVFPEDYEPGLDPFWYIISVMLVGASVIYFVFPNLPDMIRAYNYATIILPFILAILMYLCYLFDIAWFTNLFTFVAALIISYMQADDFQLFPKQLTLFQDRLVTAVLLFIVSKGLGLLNGQGGIASMQFCAVMIAAVFLAHFEAIPLFLAVIALVYLGSMLGFAFFSWPPEKIVMSHGAFSCFGFLMGCFMLNAATEFADAPIFIAASYLFTEVFVAFYNHVICRDKTAELYMSTSYYKISQDGQYDLSVARGILKIIVIDIVLSIIQIAASERLALVIFSVAFNLWFLSILSGNTRPSEILSLTKFGKMAVKGLLKKKDK